MSSKYKAGQFVDPRGGVLESHPNLNLLGAFAGVPTASVAGYEIGAIAVDITNGNWYRNTGSTTSATWTRQSGTITTETITNLTATNAALTNAAITNGSLGTSGTFTVNDAGNFALGTGSGTMVGTASNQKLGLWGVTPVIQPASTGEFTGGAALAGNTNASTVYVTNQSNFNGNTGSTKYTVNDIVKALKQAGILQT